MTQTYHKRAVVLDRMVKQLIEVSLAAHRMNTVDIPLEPILDHRDQIDPPLRLDLLHRAWRGLSILGIAKADHLDHPLEPQRKARPVRRDREAAMIEKAALVLRDSERSFAEVATELEQ